MNFYVVKIVSLVVLPTAFLVLLATLGLVFHRWRGGRVALCVGVFGLMACWLLPVETWAARPLEDRFPMVTDPPAHLDGIIVLGGAIEEFTSEDRGEPELTGAANRLTTLIILAKRYPDAKLVFTGGSGHIEQGVTNEAKFVRILLSELGMDTSRIIFESRSRTTFENAAMSRDLVHPQPGEVWALVTSAIHMPRSVGVFRAAGWPVLPWPVGYHTRDRITAYTGALGDKLSLLDWAAHEWEGLAAYWLSGETSALVPAPSPSSSAGAGAS
jgi:uncharacterized SAM-binding protein YcdF (DUF218 family)